MEEQIKELKQEIEKLKKEIEDIKANYLTFEKLTTEMNKIKVPDLHLQN